MPKRKGVKHCPESFKIQVKHEYEAGASMTSLHRKYGSSIINRVVVRTSSDAKFSSRIGKEVKSDVKYRSIHSFKDKYNVRDMCDSLMYLVAVIMLGQRT